MPSPSLALKEKIWGDEPYPSIVRLIGYHGITMEDFEELTRSLKEKYGDSVIYQARIAVAATDYEKKPYRLELRPDIRPIVWPILGPDPENPRHDWKPYRPPKPLDAAASQPEKSPELPVQPEPKPAKAKKKRK